MANGLDQDFGSFLRASYKTLSKFMKSVNPGVTLTLQPRNIPASLGTSQHSGMTEMRTEYSHTILHVHPGPWTLLQKSRSNLLWHDKPPVTWLKGIKYHTRIALRHVVHWAAVGTY